MANENTDVEQEPQAPHSDFIEYLGEEPYGVDFLTSHTLPKGDGLWKRSGLKVSKDLTWERDPFGPGHGQAGNRMLLPVADLPDGVAEVLAKTPGYKRVSE